MCVCHTTIAADVLLIPFSINQPTILHNSSLANKQQLEF